MGSWSGGTRGFGFLEGSGDKRHGEKCLDSEYILEGELSGFADGLDVACEGI